MTSANDGDDHRRKRTGRRDQVAWGVQMLTFKSANDVLDYAIARETDAYNLYTGMAPRVTKPDVRAAIENFALDEVRHRIRLEAIKAGETAFREEEVGSLGIADTLPDMQPYPDMSYTELLIFAMNKEKLAFRTYTNLAAIAKKADVRDTLLRLAQEEAEHKLRLEIEYDLATS